MGSNRKKVLLVDDDRAIRTMYRDLFEKNGFSVHTEESAIGALEILASGEAFDVVVTDIMMAKMDGWELLDTIRGMLKLSDTELPVVVISAFESDTLEVKAYSHGANASFIKGKDPLTKLLRLVRIQTGLERSKYSD